jgi:hypothetical protein
LNELKCDDVTLAIRCDLYIWYVIGELDKGSFITCQVPTIAILFLTMGYMVVHVEIVLMTMVMMMMMILEMERL